VTAPIPREDSDVPAVWQALGLPWIVDAHVHAMPDALQAKVWAYFDSAGPLLGRSWPVLYKQDLATRTQLLRDMGVGAFTSLLYPHKPGMSESLNSWAAQFARENPGCLQTATFFPEPGAAAYVRRAIEAGAQVFKVHVQVGRFDPRDEHLEEVWGLLTEARIPAVVHCGHGPVGTEWTGIGVWSQVMARHPRLRAIIAHLGMPEVEAFLDLADIYPELRFDTAGVFVDFTEDMWPFPTERYGRLLALGDRILFGSDYPTIPNTYAHQVSGLLNLGLGTDWLRAVFRDNALRLWPSIGDA
jgi:predicted TIM-barrel fold metal-dependent hydrolase